jgi:hypothetical protein
MTWYIKPQNLNYLQKNYSINNTHNFYENVLLVWHLLIQYWYPGKARPRQDQLFLSWNKARPSIPELITEVYANIHYDALWNFSGRSMNAHNCTSDSSTYKEQNEQTQQMLYIHSQCCAARRCVKNWHISITKLASFFHNLYSSPVIKTKKMRWGT